MNNNLSTFRILFIVKGILNLLISLFVIAYMGFVFFLINAESGEIPHSAGLIITVVCSLVILISVAFGIGTIMAGRYLKEHRNYNFILVMSILNCLTGVLGILLGVFTIIELTKPEVKQLFGK